MPKIKIRDPKGLYTNYDESDLSFEHFKFVENWRFRDGYMETLFYELQPYVICGDPNAPTGLELGTNESIMFYDTVNFNNDPLGVELIAGELKSNYTYQLIQAEIIITKIEYTDHNVYMIYIKDENSTSWIIPYNIIQVNSDRDLLKDYTQSDKIPYIFNIDGIVKIFLPHESLWLGKINRTTWLDLTPYPDTYYMSKLVEPYSSDNLGVSFNTIGDIMTAPGRKMGITWFTNITTDPPTEDKKVKFRFNGNEGIVFFQSEKAYRYYKVYDILLMDDPGAVWSTIILWSLSSTDPAPNNIFFQKFQDEIIYNLPYTYIGNEWFFDNIKKSGSFLTGYLYFKNVGLGDGIEEWSAAGLLEIEQTVKIGDTGFSPTYTDLTIIVTGVLDASDEFVIAYENIIVNKTADYILRIEDIKVPIDITKRLTGINFYLKKHKDESDYEQIKSFNLLSREEIDLSESFYINKLSPNGIFMNQTIGIIFDYHNHKLIDIFDDYEIANGIAYNLRNNIIYYPSIGNGKVSENIFYKQYFIPNLSEDKILSMSNLKETLAVHTKKGMKLVLVHDLQVGELFFVIKDTIGYIITEGEKSKQATPDGIFLLTKQGIMFTNSSQDGSVSKQIDDVVELHYKTGGIFYNEHEKELWFYLGAGDKIYIFSFQYKKWSTIDLNEFGNTTVDRIFLNNDFEIIVQSGNNLYKVVSVETGRARIFTLSMDLGEMASWKQMISVLLDFEGEARYQFFTRPVEHSIRSSHIFDISLDRRIPKHKIDAVLTFTNKSKFYGMEIDYDIQADRSMIPIEEATVIE